MSVTSGAEAFEESLSAGDRRLAKRLESFGDIVFGFSMSQLGLQLALPRVPADLMDNPAKYAIYFLTFLIIVFLWFRYHDALAPGFRPRRLDLTIAFAFLSLIGLIPYASYADVRFALSSLEGARYGLAAYLICTAPAYGFAAWLNYRNLRNILPFLNESERRARYRRFISATYFGSICALALIIDIAFGPDYGSGVMALLFLTGVVARAGARSLPGWLAGGAT